MRRSYIAAAIGLVALALLWHFSLDSHWTMRVPPNAVFTSKYVGTQTNADPKTGKIPELDVLSAYDRIIRVVGTTDWPRSVVLRDQYTARDLQTRAINFEYITDERVDPQTGAWADGPHKGEIVLFPRNVQKRTYTLRSNYVAGVPLKFGGVGHIGGLEVYLFSYQGPIDLTAAYIGTPQSPGMKLLAGQEIHCADEQFYYRTWIEPRTGSEVKVEEGCPSGDFIYDKVTGRKVAAVDRWNGVTTGASLASRITEVYNARRTYMWAALYLPVILLIGSVGMLAVGHSRRASGVLA
jgi:hypothetical protein